MDGSTPTQRQQAILDHLARSVECTYGDLAGPLRVSTMTIRRDVDRLAAGGLVIKTLRGARRVDSGQSLFETDLQARLTTNLPEKRAIAAAAAARVASGQTLFMDGSTTCLELAKALAEQARPLTVVTNSVLVCMHLSRNSMALVRCLGGHYDPVSASLYGPDTEAALTQLYPDTAFLSTKGFIPAEGTFESAFHLFHVKQVAARQAKQVVLLADHTKFGQRALAQVLRTAQIGTVITDNAAPAEAVKALRSLGCEVVVADGPGGRPAGLAPARRRAAHR